MNIRKKNILYQLAEYLFVFFCVVNFRGMWIHSPDYSYANKRIVGLLIAFFCILCCIFRGSIRVKKLKKALVIILISVIYILTHAVLSFYSLSEYRLFVLLVSVMFLYHYICGDTSRSFYKKLSDIMYIIAIVSLFFWLFGTELRIIQPSGTIYTTWTSWSITGQGTLKPVRNYYNLYYEAQSIDSTNALGYISQIRILRNTGIFTEAPMYSFLLIISLCDEIFIERNKNNKKKEIIFLIAIATTMSTTGYILAIFVLLIRYMTMQNEGVIRVFKRIALPALIVFSFIFIVFLLKSKLITSSGLTRVDDFLAGLKGWKDHPIIGSGIGNTYSYQKYMSLWRSYNAGMSNSLTQILSFGGVYLLLPYALFSVIGVRRSVREKEMGRLYFFVAFLILFIFTIVPFQAIPIYIFIEMAFHDNAPQEMDIDKDYANCTNKSFGYDVSFDDYSPKREQLI